MHGVLNWTVCKNKNIFGPPSVLLLSSFCPSPLSSRCTLCQCSSWTTQRTQAWTFSLIGLEWDSAIALHGRGLWSQTGISPCGQGGQRTSGKVLHKLSAMSSSPVQRPGRAAAQGTSSWRRWICNKSLCRESSDILPDRHTFFIHALDQTWVSSSTAGLHSYYSDLTLGAIDGVELLFAENT